MAGKMSTVKKKPIVSMALLVIKWFTTVICAAILFTMIGLHAFALSNVKLAVNDYYFADAQKHGNIAIYYVRLELYIALFLLSIIVISYSSFIIFIFTQTGLFPTKGYKKLFVRRVYYLSFATIAVALYLAMQFVYIFTISFDTGASYTNDEFYSLTAGIWAQFFGAFFHFIWMLFTLLAISVVKEKKGQLSYETGDDDSSSSSSSSSTSGKTTRGQNSTLTQSMSEMNSTMDINHVDYSQK